MNKGDVSPMHPTIRYKIYRNVACYALAGRFITQ